MESELEFTKAPKANLEAYDGMMSMIKYSTIVIVIALVAMAFFLL